MLKPRELDTEQGNLIWETMMAAETGDTPALRRLLERDPGLSRAQYWYTHPIHFAARSGHADAVKLLLDAGADPEWNGYHEGSLIAMSRDRGHERVASLLEEACRRLGRVPPGDEHPIHQAAQSDDAARVRQLLDADPRLLERGDRSGGSPLHRAVIGRARQTAELLLDRGANVHAFHSVSRGGHGGWWPTAVQAIDLAIWGWNNLAPSKGDFAMARLLLARGADYDLTVASALGDLARVEAILTEDPGALRLARANGRRALTAAVEFKHVPVVRFLLDRGADPTWPEFGADRGAALRIASGRGDRAMVELLLAHGADPNGEIDSGGNATWGAPPELRPLLIAHGGRLDPYESVYLNDDDEVVRRATEDPASAELGCGSVFTAVVTNRKRDLLIRLLDAGVRVPPVLTACRTYLLEDLEMFRVLLTRGMDPDLPDWQGRTFLHDLCRPGARDKAGEAIDRARVLLEVGASISKREDEYRSTPLAWAARNNLPEMVEFLLARGAPPNLPDDEPWSTPLAWAQRRGHAEVAEILRSHGAA